jgi:hypothetical protein
MLGDPSVYDKKTFQFERCATQTMNHIYRTASVKIRDEIDSASFALTRGGGRTTRAIAIYANIMSAVYREVLNAQVHF